MTRRPRQAFGATDHIMTFGRVIDASWSSSAVELMSFFKSCRAVKSWLTHMDRAVVTDQDIKWRYHTNERCQPCGVPSSNIGIVEKRSVHRRPRSHHPQWDHNDEYSAKMKDQKDG